MIGVLLSPFRPIRRRHLALMRQIAGIQHSLLDQSTVLGYLWSLLHPLLLLLVLYTFFSRRVGEEIPHYAFYLLIGLVQFTHFTKSTGAAMRVLHRMRNLVTTVIFPKDILVYSALLSNAPEFIISMAATVLIGAVAGVPLTWALLLLPVVLVAQMLLVLWTSLLLAVAYVFVRDLDHLYDIGTRLLFFVTPIIYHPDILSPGARMIARLNPLAHVMEFARGIILEGRLPSPIALSAFLLANLVLAWFAALVFRRLEPALLERL